MLLRGGAGGLLLVALAEALDAAGRVHQLLLAGEEGMALAADVDLQRFLRRVRDPGLAAGAVDLDLVVFGVDVLLHGTAHSTPRQPPAQAGRNFPARTGLESF